MKQPLIVVQGSLNYDITVKSGELAKVGETLIGSSYETFSGGKGANQAVQLAKLGAQVYMIGRVGNDSMGDFLVSTLKKYGVKTDFITRDDTGTGVGVVQRDENGNYYAVVVPNANGKCSSDDVLQAEEIIKKADAVLTQLETTTVAVECILKLADKYSVPAILNPAPAKNIDDSLFKLIHTITPNETETSFYTNIDEETLTDNFTRQQAAKILFEKGANRVIMTLGSQGCYYAERWGQELIQEPINSIKPIDTIAAGDAFNGGYVYGVATGESTEISLKFGNVAGSIAVSRKGAQSSMCSRQELFEFLKMIK